MIRRPPRSTLDRSSAASDVYKRQAKALGLPRSGGALVNNVTAGGAAEKAGVKVGDVTVSYTHLRAHETVLDLVCRLLLEKKKNHKTNTNNNT